jgi:hypothetical protein
MPCPGFRGGRYLDSAAAIAQREDVARRGYPPEFRRRVVELVEAGRKLAEVAADLVPVLFLFGSAVQLSTSILNVTVGNLSMSTRGFFTLFAGFEYCEQMAGKGQSMTERVKTHPFSPGRRNRR